MDLGHLNITATVPNAATFSYSFDWGPETTINADSSGNAQISWTPDAAGSHTLYVYETTTDGAVYDAYYYFFDVAGY